MASRVKTIEYTTQTVITTLASNTNRTLTGPTSIYIPETGITFKSVVVNVMANEDSNGATNLTSPTIAIQLGAVAFSSVTLVNPQANSGEAQAWMFSRDVTSYFTTNWTGTTTSMSWAVRVNLSGPATNNHSAKLIITYQYDDSATTQVKTIRIPVESTRSTLTTSFQTVGGSTAIPAITGSYLPETGVTIRQVWLELWGNEGTATNGNFTFQTRVNGAGGTVTDWWRSLSNAVSARWAYGIVNLTAENLSVARSLECISLTTTNRGITVGGMICVTYEYNSKTSTTIYNSLMLGAVDTAGWIGGTGSTSGGVWERNIYVEEPNTITLKESGLALYQNDSGTYTFNIAVSGDTSNQSSYSSYVLTSGSVQCGNYSLIHRIDSGGQNGVAGISLKRGKNLYRVSFYSNTTEAGWNLSGFLILNYTSGKHINGTDVHAHSVYQHIMDQVTGSRSQTSGIITPYLPETNYYLIGLLMWMNYNILSSTDQAFTLNADVVSGDPIQNGTGWLDIYDGSSRCDNENMNGMNYAAARSNFTRWNGDPDPNRINFKSGRSYRLDSCPTDYASMGMWYTYNNITFVVSGTCSGFSGDGSGIPVDIYRYTSANQEEEILNLTTTAGGTFTGNWVDDTDTLFAAARQDDTHVGRSRNGTAGS